MLHDRQVSQIPYTPKRAGTDIVQRLAKQACARRQTSNQRLTSIPTAAAEVSQSRLSWNELLVESNQGTQDAFLAVVMSPECSMHPLTGDVGLDVIGGKAKKQSVSYLGRAAYITLVLAFTDTTLRQAVA